MPKYYYFLIGPAALALLAGLTVWLIRRRDDLKVRREKQRVAEKTARRHARVIEESRKTIALARNPEVIAAQFDVIRDHAEKLGVLAEHYELPDFPKAQPRELKEFCRDQKDRTLRDRIIEQIDEAQAEAETILKPIGKITCLEKALLLVWEGRRTIQDAAMIEELEARGREIQAAIGRAVAREEN